MTPIRACTCLAFASVYIHLDASWSLQFFSFPDISVDNMQFVSRIKGKRDVHTLTVDQFTSRVRERKCTPGFTLQEYLPGDRHVAVYYDWDGKFDQKPSDGEVTEMFIQFRSDLERLHPGKSGTARFAQRHGWVTVAAAKDAKAGNDGKGKAVAEVESKGEESSSTAVATRKYKISFRAWIPDVTALLSDIPAHVRSALGLSPRAVHQNIDLSVYKSREQLLGVVGACKDLDVEKRYLLPIDTDGNVIPWDQVNPAEYLAQNPREGAAKLTLVASATAGSSGKGGKKGKGVGKTNAAAGGSARGGAATGSAGTSGAADGKETVTANDEGVKGVFATATDFFGEKYRMHEELQMLKIDREGKFLLFTTEEHWCFISRRKHERNNPYIVVHEGGSRFKCPDEVCKSAGDQPLIPLSQLPEPVRAFFQRTFFGHVDTGLMGEAHDECKKNITTNFPEEEATETSPLNNMLTTIANHQTCKKCRSSRMQFEHSLRGWHLMCIDCGNPWPSHPISLPENDFPKLFAVLSQLNLSITVNNQTINNINNYGSSEDIVASSDYDGDNLVIFDDEEMNACFIRSLQGTDAGLSDMVFMLFQDQFHCAKSGSKGTDGNWFQFGEHCWETKAELTLRKWLGMEQHFLRYYRRVLDHFERNAIQTEDVKRKIRHLKRLIDQIGDSGRRKRIVDDSIELFHRKRPTFMEDLDTANKLVFTNGVYDLSTFKFGDGRPDDLLSIQLKIPYQLVDEQSADCAYVLQFLTDIQPDEASRTYLLKVLSTCLSTDTELQLFWIFTGAGANGKSKLMNLLSDALGEHFGTAPAALLTRRREDANQANESLSALEKVRVAVFSEGSASEVLQVNTIKLFTGEDSISTRGLHEKQRRWRPKFTCILVCNDIPKLDDNSWPAWRRTKVLDFPTRFVEIPVRPHERQRDPKVGQKLAKCLWAFVAILIRYYRLFKDEGLAEPECVTLATQKYQSENDIFEEYQAHYIIEEQGARLGITELTEHFTTWATRQRYTERLPKTPAKLKELFESKLGERYKNNLNGTRLNGWRHKRLINDRRSESDL